MDAACFLLLLLFAAQPSSSPARTLGSKSLIQGSSLVPEKEGDFLLSPDGTFSSGFYKVGDNAYCFTIWFTNSADKTVVWMANRDRPVNGKGSSLTLRSAGGLVLTDADGTTVWTTEQSDSSVVDAQLLDTGNLVLINQAGEHIWESFDFPTDTLLPLQRLVKNTTLVSMRSSGTYLSGFYNLKFDDNNVIDLIFNGPSLSSIYWPPPYLNPFQNGRNPYNSTRMAFFDEMGMFESSDNWIFNVSDYGLGPKRRLTLDFDGIVRMYSLDQSTGLWQSSWSPANLDSCMVHGLCGEYGICVYDPLPVCTCPAGFVRNDPSDWTKGCKPSFNLTCNSTNIDFVGLPYADYYGYDLATFATGVSLEACRNVCLNDCKCKGFGYSTDGFGICYPKGTLLNGNRRPDSVRTMYVKVSRELAISGAKLDQATGSNDLNCSSSSVTVFDASFIRENSNTAWYMRFLIAFVAAIGAIEIIFIGLGWRHVFRNQGSEELENVGYMLLAMGFKRFNYAELKKATRNFKQEIGKGGFGTVYKGVLDDDRVVAVKRLEGILQGDAEFWAEVSIIGKINHRNLVKMWGFCAENQHKMLVYEYVENGSLDKFLFVDSANPLGLDKRYNIAVGTAKGLSYLHEECLEWVLHCDVKPQNILLDDKMEPKVSDFGMSKLFGDAHERGFSRVRGTRGYLAPEWMMNMKIDAKADVYSYGIVLLELISGRSASSFLFSASEDCDYRDLLRWIKRKIEEEGIEKVVDPRLEYEYDMKAERLLKVALLCVEEDPSKRPPMSKVVLLLTDPDEAKSHSETDQTEKLGDLV